MSFLVCHVQKYKKGNIFGIQKHVQRENENYSNTDINSSKSKLNYDLLNADKINFTERIKGIIDSQRKSKKTVRKDAVLMVETVVSSDSEFFKNLSEDKQKKFFEESLKFFKKRFGEQNIINATVHLDESTPHMHLNFVPMDQEGHLSAKRVITRVTLRKLQNDLPEHLQKCGFDIERGLEYSPKSHVDFKDYKKQQLEESKKIIEGAKRFFDEIDKVQQGAHKTIIGNNIKLSYPDFSMLIGLSKTASSLYQENVELNSKVDGFNSQLSIALKRIKSKADSDIKNAKNEANANSMEYIKTKENELNEKYNKKHDELLSKYKENEKEIYEKYNEQYRQQCKQNIEKYEAKRPLDSKEILKKNIELENYNKKLNEEISDLQFDVQDLKAAKAELIEKNRTLEDTNSNLSLKNTKLQAINDTVAEDEKKRKDEIEKLKKDLEKPKSEISKELEAKYSKALEEKDLKYDELKKDNDTLNDSLRKCKLDLQAKNEKLVEKDNEIERYKKANTKLRNKLHKTEERER